MSDETLIRAHVAELLGNHGKGAVFVAQKRMNEEMEKGDVKAAGLWLTVMYELTRVTTEQAS